MIVVLFFMEPFFRFVEEGIHCSSDAVTDERKPKGQQIEPEVIQLSGNLHTDCKGSVENGSNYCTHWRAP